MWTKNREEEKESCIYNRWTLINIGRASWTTKATNKHALEISKQNIPQEEVLPNVLVLITWKNSPLIPGMQSDALGVLFHGTLGWPTCSYPWRVHEEKNWKVY